MPHTRAHIRTVQDASTAVGWAGQRTLTIDRPESAGGMGLGYSGGELLLLAIGACYCNDLFREAAQRSIVVTNVAIDVCADWGGEPLRAQQITYTVKVAADASDAEINDLIRHTDQVAEIANSLRLGSTVTLTDARTVAATPTTTADDQRAFRADVGAASSHV